ncbi:MurR/RpiR family transcriptional regulator [Mollicutes bacterium LVI A0078]|nr:MurR/RpiR family transcriptional regulator [Mollicutes bacterium LVI A0075]WOO91760.1 MurR/RpiR family transcriptional regulator [Mollicutes bacterium LVI A0078]
MRDYSNLDVFERLNLLIRSNDNIKYDIARYLLDFEGDYSRLKIKTISEAVNVSNSTVSRFANNIGYQSYGEMIFSLDQARLEQEKDDNSDVHDRDIEKHMQDIISTFEMTKNEINEDDINNVIDLIKNSDKINIFALGETNIVAQDLQLKLVRIGFNATAYQDIHTQHFTACNSTEKTLSIALTYSSTTKEVLKNLETAKAYGSRTVLIGNQKANNSDFVDSYLNVIATESIARVFSTTSRFAMLFMIDVLYHKLIQRDEEKYTEKLTKTRLIKR